MTLLFWYRPNNKSCNGGNFGSGFVGGAVGNMAGEASKGMGMLESAGVAGLASGTTAWASGGDFATGFQAGFNNRIYNAAKGDLGAVLGEAWDKIRPNQVSFLNFNFTFEKNYWTVDLTALPDVGFGRTMLSIGEKSVSSLSVNLPKIPAQIEVGANLSSKLSIAGGYSVSVMPANLSLIKGKKKFKYPRR